MKKCFSIIVIIAFLLTACSNKVVNDVDIKNPIIISQNSIVLSNGEKVNLNLEMVKGKYFVGQNGGGTYETNWTGEYQIRVYKDINDIENYITIYPIKIDQKEMNFSGEFKIIFNDYNNDLNPDFTIGQYGTGTFNIYRLFTVLSNGKIEELKCDGGNWITIPSQDLSIHLDKKSNESFKIQIYDNEQAKLIDVIYYWEDSQFKKRVL